jgi:integrase
VIHKKLAERYLRNWQDLNTVGELLGHKTPGMTKRYARLSPSFKKRAVNVLDDLMSQNPLQQKAETSNILEFKRK